MASKRSDFYGLQFIPEATPGTDPGIIAASYVTGAHDGELYRFVPDSSQGTKYKAFARMAAPPEGLPKLELKDIPQTFQTNDYDNCKAKGLKSMGEVTLTFSLHGTIFDTTASPSTGDTDKPVPPPWLQLAGSGAGAILGYRSGDDGGPPDTVAASPTSASVFSVDTGSAVTGLVLGYGSQQDGSTLEELIRPTDTSGGTDITAASYNGAAFGLSATPTEADDIFFPCQAVFDNRLEDSSETFTMLLQRPENGSAIMLLGAQAKSWTITSNADEFPTIKITFIFRKWSPYEDASVDSDIWTGAPTLAEEPDYYASWPCPKIVAGGHFWYQDPSDQSAKRDTIDISGVEITYESGLDRYMANTAVEGVGDILIKGKQSIEFKFTTLYNSDWRSFIGACCNTSLSNGFPFHYWEGNSTGNSWFFSGTNFFVKEDPGFDGDDGGLQAQTIVLGTRKYSGDTGNSDWDGTDAIDTKYALGVF